MRFTRAMSVLLFLLAPLSVTAQSKRPLTNKDVVQMVKAGFDNQTITKAIQANKTAFDVSPQALLDLKNNGVNQKIIQAMLSRTTAEENEASAASVSTGTGPSGSSSSANPNDPMSPHPPGIYWESKAGGHTQMVVLEPSSYSRGKMTGGLKMGFTMGLSKARWKVVINGARASLRIPANKPEFWFYFANSSGSFSSGPSSPNDFTLVKLDRHHSDRELVVGKASVTGVSSGVPSKDTISVTVKQVSPGIYEAVPAKPLKPGEYAFLPAGQGGMVLSMTGGKLFDFEVDARR